MDQAACNYNPNANLQPIGSCDFPEDIDPDWCDCDGSVLDACNVCGGDGLSCAGCSSDLACNYDPDAAVQSLDVCVFPLQACDDGDATTTNDTYDDNCNCVGEAAVAGCTDDTACNYDAAATADDGSCELLGDACDDGDETTENDVLGADCTCSGTLIEVPGCTDDTACNYDAAANTDDSSCTFPGDACDDMDASTENDVLGADCTCSGTLIEVPGCTDDTACNYDAAANTDDGSCELPGDACDDGDETTENDVLGADCTCSGTLIEVPGCTDDTACNYDAAANTDDGSCELPGDACDDGDETTENDVLGADCTCSGTLIEVPGCTDDTACNYDAAANTDDGSCELPGDACDDGDETTENDVPGADCTCSGTLIEVPGCTDDTACNYDAAANTDDGSCELPGDACDDGDETTENDVLGADCTCSGTLIEVPGCTDDTACNYDAAANTDDGSCELPGDACDDGDETTENDVLGADCTCSGTLIEVPGCTDDTACNYDAAANTDDGSCELPGDACDDGDETTENDVLGADCSCAGEAIVIVEGCTDEAACNYDASLGANTDDGSCELPGDACDDGDATTTNDVLGADCSCSGVAIVEGCTNEAACNYDASLGANTDDGSCELPGDACDDGDATTENDVLQDDCSCIGTLIEVLGCTDETACNYDASLGANTDDGSCELPGDACDDGDATTTNDVLGADCSCSGVAIVEGCTNEAACNYDASLGANTDDGSCELPGDACDDGDATTTNDVLGADCSCSGVAIVEGCTNEAACNYDASLGANTDDGSCELPGDACDDGDATTTNDVLGADCSCSGVAIVEGCTNEAACNYDASLGANTDDGSCELPGDACDDGDATTENDVLQDDCSCAGTPIVDAVDEQELSFGMFPNPTSGELTLQVEGMIADANLQVLDAAGRVAWAKESLQIQGNYMLDLSTLSDGLYTVVIQSDGMSAVKRLAIQR